MVKHYSTKSEKATLIPSSYFADTSWYCILCSKANYFAYYSLTSRLSLKSFLFPIKTLQTFSGADSANDFNHTFIDSNDFLSLKSNTKPKPSAFL